MATDNLHPRKKRGGSDIHMIEDAVDNINQPLETQMSRHRLGNAAKPNYIWLVTFTDIMGLMLTFFVMMFAMTEPRNEEFAEIAASLQSELGSSYGQSYNQGTEENIDLSKVNFNRALDVRYLEELIRSTIDGHEELKDIIVIPQPDSIILSLPQELLFAPGQATVGDAGRKILYTLGGSLTRVRNRIEIDGHVGPQPLEGAQSDFGNNWELSLARAANIASILENVGYQQSIGIAGFGSGRYQDLESVNDQVQRQALARRVDINIMNHSGRTEKISSAPDLLQRRP